ncbi:SRPBCC family protein [Frankia sp. CN6]|uniref:SRPBCC family protein n=1 Tax=Frankia nepalensis TaxID=1836974 RepID=A0A937RGX5_9ACTN|nr:SRPBCC family protein [Frankia nepalensis]MBL7629907.1 SRPBCC family protein [Frankia nepalensis]
MIKQDFEVSEPLDRIWAFFQDVPGVAACLPGAELTQDLGDDRYAGNVLIRMGPVRLSFAGTASILERDAAGRRMVVDAAGADEKGRGNAAMRMTARLAPLGAGTKVDVDMDLQLSGAAAQYGRGMVADVTAVLLRDFATNMRGRVDAIERGLDLSAVAGVKPASGLAIGLRALRMALTRVFRRFFVPYTAPNAG